MTIKYTTWFTGIFSLIFFFSPYFMVSADIAYKKQYGLQDPATRYFEDIIDLHHDLMLFMVMGAVFILYMLLITIYEFHDKRRLTPPQDIRHNTFIEVVWTITPAMLLISIAIPSFVLLYSMEENIDAYINLKILGNQWYWTYECEDFVYFKNRTKPYFSNFIEEQRSHNFSSSLQREALCDYLTWTNKKYLNFNYDSVLLSDMDVLFSGGNRIRLLSVDNILLLPARVPVRCTVTATDVIHSWTIPSFGVKLDACPGRLNSALFTVKRPGIYYGQCSEICGVKHAFMPIQVNVIRLTSFWKHVISSF